jgi:hypothetical protein
MYFFVLPAHGICNYRDPQYTTKKILTRFSITQGHEAHIPIPRHSSFKKETSLLNNNAQ